LDRADAVAILKEMLKQNANPDMISLKKITSDSYELHIKPQVLSVAEIKLIAERHNFQIKEDNGLVIVFS
jgi:hypothetical protein